MSTNSKIEWTDHTFNPWIGCTKVSPGCEHCYADAQDKFRKWTPEGWGKGKPRKRTSESNWKKPLEWNAMTGAVWCDHCDEQLPQMTWYAWHQFTAHDNPICPLCQHRTLKVRRARVFCASLADWLDDEVPIEWLADLLALIHATPNLDWQLLTKRPGNFKVRLLMAGMTMMGYRDGQAGTEPSAHPSASEDTIESVLGWSKGETYPGNVWIGTTVEDQARADERIPQLLAIPAELRFLSCEPLLEEVNLRDINGALCSWGQVGCIDNVWRGEIHWVICGGESGPSARPIHPEWARSLRDQCHSAGIPFFFKQWGEHCQGSQLPDTSAIGIADFDEDATYRVGKTKAGRLLDGREWSEFPNPQSAIRDPQSLTHSTPA